MKRLIKAACFGAAKLLLCFLIFSSLGCSSLKNRNDEVSKDIVFLFQVAVKESDFTVFNQRIQQLRLVAVDFHPAKFEGLNGEDASYSITFRFMNRRSYLAGSSAIMSTGLAYPINYQY